MNLQKAITTSFCMSCLAATIANGQENRPTAQTAQPARNPVQVQVGAPAGVQVQAGGPRRHGKMMTNDQILANCIAISNQTEVAVAKEAQSRVTNKDVKEFAAMLVKDHQEFLQKLQQFAPEATREGYLSATAAVIEPQQGPAEANRNRSQQSANAAKEVAVQSQQVVENQANSEANQHLDMVQLHREIAQECIQSAKNAMSKKEGNEADMCFVGFQIAAHAMMKDKLTVFQRHASAELNPAISEGLAATERHMKKAEEIMKTLRKGNDQRVTSKD